MTAIRHWFCPVPFNEELSFRQYLALSEVQEWFETVEDSEGRIPFSIFALTDAAIGRGDTVTLDQDGLFKGGNPDIHIAGPLFTHRGITGIPWWFLKNRREPTAKDIEGEGNVEVRRLFMERIGLDKFITSHTVVSEDNYGQLWHAHLSGESKDVRVHLLVLENKTPETNKEFKAELKAKGLLGPNEGRLYIQWAHPDAKTAKEAVEYAIPHGTAFLEALTGSKLPDEGFELES